MEFESFLHNFKRLDSDFPIAELQNKPIIFDYNYAKADTKLLRDMALYNEFAGQDIPLVYLRKVSSSPIVRIRFAMILPPFTYT